MLELAVFYNVDEHVCDILSFFIEIKLYQISIDSIQFKYFIE
jgi:hypothetical protein